MPVLIYDYTRCRTYGHAWFEADSDWNSTMGTPITLRCERCMAERREAVSHTGQLISRHYVYPKNYQYSSADERPSKDEFRVALLALRLREARRAKNGRKTS